jgi:hypothetical protein
MTVTSVCDFHREADFFSFLPDIAPISTILVLRLPPAVVEAGAQNKVHKHTHKINKVKQPTDSKLVFYNDLLYR